MTEAFILDAVRTPRGKGRASGAPHEVGVMAGHFAVESRQRAARAWREQRFAKPMHTFVFRAPEALPLELQ